MNPSSPSSPSIQSAPSPTTTRPPSVRDHPALRRLRDTPIWVPLRAAFRAALRLLGAVGVRQSPQRLAEDAQAYWAGAEPPSPNMSHWRGQGGIEDGEFDALGARNVQRYRRFATALDQPTADLTVVEWGCGGGAVLSAFAPHASSLVGIDVSARSLELCEAEIASHDGPPFTPVLVEVSHPEGALARIPDPVDLFLCVNVIELLPTPAHGQQIIEMAHRMLRPGGLAILQFRYDTGGRRTAPAGRFYRHNTSEMVSYPIHDFWERCIAAGLEPRLLELAPEEDVIGTRYAYLAATRPR